jgi:hypothetical protein
MGTRGKGGKERKEGEKGTFFFFVSISDWLLRASLEISGFSRIYS